MVGTIEEALEKAGTLSGVQAADVLATKRGA